MSMSSKIFDAITAGIRLNDTLINLAADVKDLTKEINDIDRRLVRIETLVEISEKQSKLLMIE